MRSRITVTTPPIAATRSTVATMNVQAGMGVPRVALELAALALG